MIMLKKFMRKVVNILKKYEFLLENLDCPNCANKIQEKISKLEGVKDVNVNFSKLKLTYKTDTVSKEEIENIIVSMEPEVVMKEYTSSKIENENSKINIQIIRLIIGIMFTILGTFTIYNEILREVFIITAYLTLLYRTMKNAIILLRKNKSIDESFLITISCLGAYFIGERFEGLMVIILYEIGKILENKAVNKTRKSIADLMNIKPEYANVKRNDNIEKVEPENVLIGEIIVIKQGEKIPLDGKIIKGKTSLNTASLTGESKLRKVKVGDEVLSGSINTEDVIEVEVTEKYENSTVSKILELVENASDKKAKTETFVNKAAKIYTPIVISLALIVGIFLPIITDVTYKESIYRALVFLVISCPCAIAISVPLSYFSGIGKASKEGVLIKGSDYLDLLKDVKEIVFDKTGTLTEGKFGIEKIELLSNNYTQDDLEKYLVLGESFSNHPIAKSILNEIKIESLVKDEVKDYKEISGKGLKYNYKNKNILIGNEELVEYTEDKKDANTRIFVKVDNDIIGYVSLADKIKEGTKTAIVNLNSYGIKTKMFTGDNLEVAKKVANKIGIKEIKAEMLPTDKYNEIEKLIEENNSEDYKIAFVGDGINDSPVLAIADVGISMGGVGSQSAIEASDIVIMTDKIERILEAIKISKKTTKIIKENLIFAIVVKVLILSLSALGLANMWEAIFADVGVTLITIFNTLRILK